MPIGFQIHGDLALSDGGRRLVLRQGADEYADRVRVALQIFQGVWHFDQSVGMRFFSVILEKPAAISLEILRAEVWRVIAAVPGTSAVLSVTTEYNSVERSAILRWTARSQAGIVSGEATVA